MRDNDLEEYEKFSENFAAALEFGITSYGMLKRSAGRPAITVLPAKQEKLPAAGRVPGSRATTRRPSTTPSARASSAWPRCPS